MQDIIEIVGITLLPFLELRASIPYGIMVKDMNWLIVFFVCITANIILAAAVYIFIDRFIHLFLKIKVIDRIYSRYIEKAQKKIHRHVERYGDIGLAVFIGIPLPGSGVYSGAIAAYAFGIGFRKFMIAASIGALIAGTMVTAASILGGAGLGMFIKTF